jgi:hypothetical protein
MTPLCMVIPLADCRTGVGAKTSRVARLPGLAVPGGREAANGRFQLSGCRP